MEVCCLTKMKKIFQCLRGEREAMCHYFYLRRLGMVLMASVQGKRKGRREALGLIGFNCMFLSL